MRYTYLLLLLISLCLCSCKKDKQGTTPATPEKILGIKEFADGNILAAVKCDNDRLMVLTVPELPLGTNKVIGIDEKGQLWFRNTFTEDSIDAYAGIAEGPDNGVVLAADRKFGFQFSMGLLHFDKNGQRLWSMGAGFENPTQHPKFVMRTYDGNYMALDSWDLSLVTKRQRLIWFTPDGTWLRTRQIDVSGEVYWINVTETPDHGYLCTGSRTGNSGPELFVVKISEQGTMLWQRALPGIPSVGMQGIGLDDGGAIICGRYNFDQYTTGLLMRLSATGEVQWQQEYTIGSGSSFNDIISDGNGGCMITGGSSGEGTTSHTILCSVDPNGVITWKKDYDVVAEGVRLFKRNDGGYTILSNIFAQEQHFFVIITDKDGNIEE